LVDKKITELEEITTTSGSSIIYVIDYSSGSPKSDKIMIDNLFIAYNWTPVLTQGNQTPTISGYTAKYVKIGKTIQLWGYLPIQSSGQASQLIIVTGLPISPVLDSWQAIGSFFGMDYGTGILAGVVQILNDSGWKLYFSSPNANNWLGINPAWTLANQDYLTFSINYLIA
jgi:hypothetical protein